jgi:hypothetical protein
MNNCLSCTPVNFLCWHEVKTYYGDVVGLAEALGDLGYVAGWFMADLLGAFEAEELAFGVCRFNDAVGDEGEAVAVFELEGGLLVFDVWNDTKGQAGG